MTVTCQRGHEHPAWDTKGLLLIERVGPCYVTLPASRVNWKAMQEAEAEGETDAGSN